MVPTSPNKTSTACTRGSFHAGAPASAGSKASSRRQTPASTFSAGGGASILLTMTSTSAEKTVMTVTLTVKCRGQAPTCVRPNRPTPTKWPVSKAMKAPFAVARFQKTPTRKIAAIGGTRIEKACCR